MKKPWKEEKKGKKSEEPTVKPPKVIGAYFFFSGEMVPKLKAEENLTHKDAMRRAGELWGKLSAEDKVPYEE